MRQGLERKTRAGRRELWREVIEAAEASGETIRGFCRRHGIAPSHYYYWRRRLRPEGEAARAAGGAFVLVGTTETAPEPAPLELHVGRGWRLRIGAGVDERALRVVLTALAAQA